MAKEEKEDAFETIPGFSFTPPAGGRSFPTIAKKTAHDKKDLPLDLKAKIRHDEMYDGESKKTNIKTDPGA